MAIKIVATYRHISPPSLAKLTAKHYARIMARFLAKDATFRDLTGAVKHREEYLRRVVQNFEGKAHREKISVRMGIAGKGVSPHYKFEADVDLSVFDLGMVGSYPEAF